ncbi:16S rRNA (cytosine(967)-C(5))-methyltransferase RsmB [Terrilactibacillus laevilacticus]|uniref:16S rRNA (cytosine(967)-C(5))-methyltransferase n=1 Tax=Terrilactibacillus laevilacticus TaxID=1380157 RepID=A0ABW5PQ01_9BACI|nr:16S rRNA (cytosine(967)-C(5))-methyltransferase RsmB [Terrilactibacillus laevilacticus]
MGKPMAREIALDVLLKIEKQHAYSQLALNEAIEKQELKPQDRALITQIVYGVLQWKKRLNYILENYVNSKRKRDDWVNLLLLISIYQKEFLSKIPDHAIVNEAVVIARKRGHQGISGFVNGVLRQYLRKGSPDLSKIEPEVTRQSIIYSHPEWLINQWTDDFGKEAALNICKANNQPPTMTIRVNTLKQSKSELINQLSKEGIEAVEGELSPYALVIKKGRILKSPLLQEGAFTVQDESSMLVADSVHAKPGMRVLDACAGPGGKTSHIAELMENQGEIVAFDLHKHKTRLIDQHANRLGLSIIHTMALDAREAQTQFKNESFDRILVDAPCTGLGVIRHKPEIKWEKKNTDVERIVKIQQDIIQQVAPLLKKGGRLIYSTCTIDKRENEKVIYDFLSKNSEFEWEQEGMAHLPKKIKNNLIDDQSMVQILPSDYGTDGFFICCLRRKKA